MTAWLVIHQSQLRVPPIPLTAPPPRSDRYGNWRPELRSAVLLPTPGGPMITYQGREISASLPSFEPLSAPTALLNSDDIALMSACMSGRAPAAWAAPCLASARSILLAARRA